MNTFAIYAVFRHTPEGRTALKFAADLLKHLRGEKLYVCLAGGNVRQAALMTDTTAAEVATPVGANLLQARNVSNDVRNETGLTASQIELVGADCIAKLPPDAILVDHDGKKGEPNVLVPFDEEGLEVRGAGPMLIPFGTDESALRAAALGIPLAKLLGREVVFYHTTWKDRTVAVPDPAQHMCEKARSVNKRLVDIATAAGVKQRTIVEMAQDVVLGTMRCAVRERANLIVMSREPKIIFGSYVDRALLQSVVPILVAGIPGGRHEPC